MPKQGRRNRITIRHSWVQIAIWPLTSLEKLLEAKKLQFPTLSRGDNDRNWHNHAILKIKWNNNYKALSMTPNPSQAPNNASYFYYQQQITMLKISIEELQLSLLLSFITFPLSFLPVPSLLQGHILCLIFLAQNTPLHLGVVRTHLDRHLRLSRNHLWWCPSCSANRFSSVSPWWLSELNAQLFPDTSESSLQ